jgi:hypothetical protein
LNPREREAAFKSMRLAEWASAARITLLCGNDETHRLGAIVRLDDPDLFPAGQQPDEITWSDGQGTVVIRRWGKYGSIGVDDRGKDRAPAGIEARCETCARRRLPGSRANPRLTWSNVIKLLDHQVSKEISDSSLQMRGF